ncbi:MAG: hypothetical protein DVB26_03340 [Verrucomicrobia bacterium]|nr:MAG: hypothetical protein DVB26_03340 [Verrucomicrobiota bacterium]
MKNLFMLVALAGAALGLSSCCSMFGKHNNTDGYRTETYQVKTWGYDTVTEQVLVKGGTKSCKEGLVVTVTKKVPRYKTVTKKVRISSGPNVQMYCPKKDSGGSTSEETLRMSSAQGSSGSPNIGLMPTMRALPLEEKKATP